MDTLIKKGDRRIDVRLFQSELEEPLALVFNCAIEGEKTGVLHHCTDMEIERQYVDSLTARAKWRDLCDS